MSLLNEKERPVVYVIDDDASVREAIGGLFESVGLQTETHASVQEFLTSTPSRRPCCIVLDIRLPGQSGLEFQEALANQSDRRPIVVISGHVDVQMACGR